jgi:hypothetical protein
LPKYAAMRPLCDATVDGSGDPLGLHKPGFRVATVSNAKQDARTADAYEEHRRYLEKAYRGNAFTGQRGSKPGDACTIDGRPGCLQFDDDGELVCRAKANSADTPSRGRADSRPLEAIMRDHGQAMAQIYADVERELTNAWRRE